MLTQVSWNRLRRLLRQASVVVVVALPLALWFGGAQPVAVGLVQPPWDILLHLLVFAAWSFAITHAGGWRDWRGVVIALLAVAALGGLDEWHQAQLPGRHPGWDDWWADMAGALLGSGLGLVRHRVIPCLQAWRAGAPLRRR